jgi:hypothetical protein
MPRITLAWHKVVLMSRRRQVWGRRATNRLGVRMRREVGCIKWGITGYSLETMVLHSY